MKEILLILSYVLISSVVVVVVAHIVSVKLSGSFTSRILYIALQQAIGAGLLFLAIKLGKFPI